MSNWGERSTRPTGRPVLSEVERIDRLVYQLYGLTNDEIAIVEAATAGYSALCGLGLCD